MIDVVGPYGDLLALARFAILFEANNQTMLRRPLIKLSNWKATAIGLQAYTKIRRSHLVGFWGWIALNAWNKLIHKLAVMHAIDLIHIVD